MTLLGKQSHAALSAQTRYKDVPKQGRLDALRPYLAKHNCFPPGVKDFASAHIGMDELKLLVRQWNMHHERNFWRNHPDRDAVVMALYQKLKARKEQRKQKLAIHELLQHHSLTGTAPAPSSTSPRHTKPAAQSGTLSTALNSPDDPDAPPFSFHPDATASPSSPPVLGFTRDLFHHRPNRIIAEQDAYLHALSSEGLLVMSRCDGVSKAIDPRFAKATTKTVVQHEHVERAISPSQVEHAEMMRKAAEERENPVDDPKIRVKRKCAAALLNMSLREQMETQFVEEGGLKSLIELAGSTTDRETLTYCMSCILNLSGECRRDSKLFEFQIIAKINQLADTSDQRIRQYSAKSLAFFTMLPDIEERLVGDGIVPPLTKLALHSPNPVTRQIATKGLMNLSHVLTGSQADSVNKHIMDCLKKLVVLGVPFLAEFVGETIQNLSTLANARGKIAEEGAIEVLNTLIRQDPNKATMRAVAISLCNLSVLKSCRKDMIKMNVIEVLTQLLGSGITDTVYLCTLALSNLTAAPDLRQIVANKGAITVLCTLLSSPHAPTCAVASKSLANFACDGACRAKVIAANAVPPMLNLFANADEAVRSDSLGAIINLLSFPDTYHHVVECDLITHLKDIMHHTMHLDAIAMALFNVTTYPDMHPMLIEQGGAELLVSLLLNPNLSHLVEQNLASLANIAKTKGVTPALIKAGIVQALWTPIANAIPSGETTAVLPTATATKLAHILMDLSTTEDACKPLVAEGGVLSLVQLARQDDDVTKLAVAAVFYNLSLKKVLADHGFLDALIELSNTSLNKRVVWCAITFSNLSTYPRGRTMFGKSIGQVAPCLAAMMRSGCKDAEKIQKHCAIALCNCLSVWLKQGDIEGMVETGLIQDLIVITVLRVNVDYIKENLAKALFNLLITQSTRQLMVEQGIMHSLIRLSKQVASHEVVTLCVTALQNLTCEPLLAQVYIDKLLEMGAVNALVGQCVTPMSGLEVKKMCAAALANLSRLPQTHSYMLKEPLIHAFNKVCSQRHCEEWVEKCAECLFNLSKDPANHDGLLKLGVVKCVSDVIDNGNAACRILGICSLANLTVSANAFSQVTTDGMHCLISTLKHVHMPVETRMNAMRAICNLVVEFEPARKEAVESELVPALGIMMKLLAGEGGEGANEDEMAMIAKIMREISYYEDGHVLVQESKGANILLRLSKLENAEIKSDVSIALLNLSTCKFVTQLIDDGVVEAVFWLTLQDLLGMDKIVYERCSAIIRNLCTNEKGINRVVLENKLMVVLKKMADYKDEIDIKYNACISLYNIACHQDSQELFVRNGIIPALVGLAELGSSEVAQRMRNIASAALHQFSQDLLKDPKIISILMSLLTMDTAVLDDCEVIQTVKSMKGEFIKGWILKQTSCEYSFSEVMPSWLNIVVERILTFIPGKVEGEELKAVEMGGDGAQAVARIEGEYKKMMVEHVKQSPKEFSLPLPGADLTMEAKIDMFKAEEAVEEDEEEEEEGRVENEEEESVSKGGKGRRGSRRNSRRNSRGSLGRGESYDVFTESDLAGKLPALVPPPPQSAVLDPTDPNYTLSLLSHDQATSVRKVDQSSMGASFGSNVKKNVPLLPQSAHGISGEGEGARKGGKSKFGSRDEMRASFKVGQQKKAVALEDDYKQMLMMRENGLF